MMLGDETTGVCREGAQVRGTREYALDRSLPGSKPLNGGDHNPPGLSAGRAFG